MVGKFCDAVSGKGLTIDLVRLLQAYPILGLHWLQKNDPVFMDISVLVDPCSWRTHIFNSQYMVDTPRIHNY